MQHRVRWGWVALSMVALSMVALVACAGESTTKTDAGGTPGQGRIGPEGGDVTLPNGTGVSIPPGAFEDDTTITVTEEDELPPLPDGYVAAGEALSIEPHQVPIGAPVTITLAYTGAASTVFRLDSPTDTTWEPVTGVTFANGRATFESNEFGIFVVARRGSGMIFIDAGGDAGTDASSEDAGTDASSEDAGSEDAGSNLDAGSEDAGTAPIEVLDVDFESTLPNNIDVGGGVLTPSQGFSALGFGDTFLRGPTGNTITITFNDLPAHNAITIDFLFAAIDSLDGTGSFPAGDFFRVQLDGVTIFRESFANATPSQIQSYIPAPGVELARRVDLGFSGPGGYYTDSAYDFGNEPFFQDIPHTASSATLTFTLEGAGVQDINDESWAIDNLRVITHTLSGSTPQCSDITSDFSVDLDGWTQTGATVFEQRTTGGNPGGLLYADTSDLEVTYVYAGSKFLGDRYDLNGGTLRFDANMLEGGGSAWMSASQDHGWVRITSGSEFVEFDLVPGDMGPSLATWTTYSVPLTADAWGKSEAQWRAMLSNITELRICLEGLYGAEIQALDNVTLQCEAEINDQ